MIDNVRNDITFVLFWIIRIPHLNEFFFQGTITEEIIEFPRFPLLTRRK